DRRFATELVYGTTRMRRACAALVERFTLTDPDPEVRTLLRLGAYQIVYGNVAPHAAVSETVELAHPKVRGFVNAVLRKVVATPMVWAGEAEQLSYPDWIVERYIAETGDYDATVALATMNEPPPVSERDDGYVQDLGSQWVAELVDAQPGELVLDVCAAPGGKATAMAATGATVIAADRQAQRVGLVTQNAHRLPPAGRGRRRHGGAIRVGQLRPCVGRCSVQRSGYVAPPGRRALAHPSRRHRRSGRDPGGSVGRSGEGRQAR
ncbi:MAG TPA: transcription antitermination factor NusB, partial [Ilumatobacteraceae bacterium]|nr:transcription antitermination factor NusB [Ilumatobacteraceae bacterium]